MGAGAQLSLGDGTHLDRAGRRAARAAARSAVLSVLAAVAGAALGPRWADLARVRHPLARGLAHGVASHGIGTARKLEETRLAGATAAVGMALGGAMVAFALPLIY